MEESYCHILYFQQEKKYYNKNSIIIIILNGFICIALFILAFFINFIAVNQSISLEFLFITPGFIIIWIILLIFSIKFYD